MGAGAQAQSPYSQTMQQGAQSLQGSMQGGQALPGSMQGAQTLQGAIGAMGGAQTPPAGFGPGSGMHQWWQNQGQYMPQNMLPGSGNYQWWQNNVANRLPQQALSGMQSWLNSGQMPGGAPFMLGQNQFTNTMGMPSIGSPWSSTAVQPMMQRLRGY